MMSSRNYYSAGILLVVAIICVHESVCLANGGGDNQMGQDFGLCGNLEGSKYNNGSCYKVFGDLVTWNQAQEFCATQVSGSRLAEPESTQAIELLYNLIVSANIEHTPDDGLPLTEGSGWLGARRETPASLYRWSSNSISIWNVPDALSGDMWPHPNTEMNCLSINHHGHMSGRDCDLKGLAICQISVERVCETTARYYDGYCYTYHGVTGTFGNSKSFCKERNAELVEIYSQDAGIFLKEFLLDQMWKTISFSWDSDFVDLTKYGISKRPGADFCFLVKGLGDGRMMISKPEINSACTFDLHLDSFSGSNPGHLCGRTRLYPTGNPEGFDILFHPIHRSESETRISFYICGNCYGGCSDMDSPVEMTIPEDSGDQFSYFCLEYKDDTLTLSHYEEDGRLSAMGMLVFLDPDFVMDDLTKVVIMAPTMTYQWKFPMYDPHSVFLGADGSEDTWLSGKDIDYKVLGIPELSGFSNNRLMFQTYPSKYLATSGETMGAAILCRNRWGAHSYFGVVPFVNANNTWLYLSHTTTGLALLNYQPYLSRKTDPTHAYVKVITPDDGTISLQEFFDDNEDIEEGRLFLIRSDDPITVELFSKSSDHAYSTLVFPSTVSHTDYIISAPNAKIGRIFIINLEKDNTVSTQIPRLREVTIGQGGSMYRAYYIKAYDLQHLDLVTYDFQGDISGTTISGTKKIAVFVGSSVSAPIEDISLDQALPAPYMIMEYCSFELGIAASASETKFRTVALMNDTKIQISNEPDVTLSLHSDTNVTAVTSRQPQVLRGNQPFYASIELSDNRMVCTTTLLPTQYWKTVYTIAVSTQHQLSEILTLFLTVNSLHPPVFKINGVTESTLDCSGTQFGHYYSCFLGLEAKHYTLESATSGQQFAAYICGIDPGSSCFCRPAGIESFDGSGPGGNGYRTPPFEEPQECPEPSPQTEAPPTLTTTETYNITMTTTEDAPPTTEEVPITTLPTIAVPTHPYFNVILTPSIIEEIQEKVREALRIDVHTVSKFVRKKISAPDTRTSSSCMGYMGVVMISMVTALIIIPDVMLLGSWVMQKVSMK